jgi:GT2 family glycosyltransferase
LGDRSVAHPTLIGIVTRNRVAVLRKALASALAQSAADLHVAVIDDGSSDETERLQHEFGEVSWEFRSAPRGHMSARNEFMARPGFEFFVSLDDDAWFLQGDEVAVALKYFEDDPSLAAVAFDIVSPDRPQTRERALAQPVNMFIGCGHMLRLSAIRAVGDYVPTPGGYGGEEKDLCVRLIDAGQKVIRLPGVHVWHDKTPVARDITYQHRSGVCNDLVMAVRRTPLPLLPAIVPVKLARHLVFSWRAGLLAPCLSGMALFARSLPSVWRWRKPVRIETLRIYSALSQE